MPGSRALEVVVSGSVFRHRLTSGKKMSHSDTAGLCGFCTAVVLAVSVLHGTFPMGLTSHKIHPDGPVGICQFQI